MRNVNTALGRTVITLAVATIAGFTAWIATSGTSASGDASSRLKPCNAATPLYSPGKSIYGLRLAAVRRVCSAPEPTSSEAAGGQIDPDSLTRSNYTTFLYGDCHATSDQGCALPLEVQVWPACERNPASFARDGGAGPTVGERDLGPDERGEDPTLIDRTTVRGVPVDIYKEPVSQDGAGLGATDEPARVELSVGDSTVVVFASGANADAPSQKRDRLIGVVKRLVPSGTSNSPSVPSGATAEGIVAQTSLPDPDAGVLNGSRSCAAR